MPRLLRLPVGRRPAWRGAAVAVLVAAAGLLTWSTGDQLGWVLDPAAIRLVLTDVAVAVAAAGVLTGVGALTLGRFVALPWSYLWAALTVAILLVTLGAGPSLRGWLLAVGIVVVGASLLGAGAGRLLATGRQSPAGRGALPLLTAAGVILGTPALWLVTAGGPAPDTAVADPETGAALVSPGPLGVRVTDYGSGTDPRPRYGAEVAVRTEPVDATGLLGGWSGARAAQWGFGPDRLPLNARVWHPAGAGPFPLVLILHGNLSRESGSELGFDYLAEALASHGFVVAAIDQHFLDTAVSDRAGGLSGAMQTRGWLALEHLRVWRDWARQPQHPLGSKVDLDRVGLVGHSRGGEAVAAAAHFAQRGGIPGHDAVEVADGFSIESLVALAPSDGQYRPAGQGLVLADVDYLVLHGSHDADVGSFVGRNQYERVAFSGDEPRVKGAVHIAHANHAQFNRRWGRHDLGNGLAKHFLDTTALLPAKAQRDIALAYTAGFLRATLDGQHERLRLLHDPDWAERALPTPDLVTQYAHAGTVWLPHAGADQPGRVHQVVWQADEVAREVHAAVPPGRLHPDSVIVVDAVALSGGRWREQVTLRVTGAAGVEAEVPLTAADRPLQGVIAGQRLKSGWLEGSHSDEPVPQTYAVPAADLLANAPGGRLEDVTGITVRLGDTGAGAALIGALGVSPDGPPGVLATRES